MVDLPYPNDRNKGLKPLVPHDPLTLDPFTLESGF
jgi:hypothetical protein